MKPATITQRKDNSGLNLLESRERTAEKENGKKQMRKHHQKKKRESAE